MKNKSNDTITMNGKKVAVEDKKQHDKKGDNKEPVKEGLRPEDLPDASNESTGKMGSGQRQDSN